MKVNAKQKNAKSWSRKLVAFNESQAGQVQISYKGDDGNKKVGYCEITDISLAIGEKEITLGELLFLLIENQNKLAKENSKIKSDLKELKNEVAKVQDIMVKHFPQLMR